MQASYIRCSDGVLVRKHQWNGYGWWSATRLRSAKADILYAGDGRRPVEAARSRGRRRGCQGGGVVPSVHDLVTRLGPDLISTPVATVGLAVEFTSVVIYDPLEVPAFEAGDLVLAVGVSAKAPRVASRSAADHDARRLAPAGRVVPPAAAGRASVTGAG